MAKVTFQVLDGVDRGRIFRELDTPVTVGREEGNVLRLNDERVSRFHAKVQIDNDDFILTDLDSTNGTRVNGTVVQIRRLRPGDRVKVGQSLLLFGSNEEIAARMAAGDKGVTFPVDLDDGDERVDDVKATQAPTIAGQADDIFDFDLNLKGKATSTRDAFFIGKQAMPPLPERLTPSQAARASEILDFLHRGLTAATDQIQANDDGTRVTLDFADWQKVLAVQMLLSRYLRAIADPDSLDGS